MNTSASYRRPGRRTVALATALLLGVGGSALAAPAAVADGKDSTLRMPVTGNGIDTLNPFLAYFSGSLDVFAGIYPTLNTAEDDGTPKPYLAESWETSEDKLTWTFTFRKGLKWSDGEPITAEDAAWTFNMIMKDATAATANGSLVENFDSVTAPDAGTLVVKTKKPQANMLTISIPTSGIPIVPKHIWEPQAKKLKDFKNDSYPVVGYGPWKLTDYKREQYVKFDANKDFHLGAPKFDHMIQRSFKNADAMVAALRSGELDYLPRDLNPTQFQSLQGQKDLKTFQAVGNRWNAIEINGDARTRSGKKMGTGHPALGDVTVRTALALAIDREAVVKKIHNGLAQVGDSYLPPSLPQYDWKPSASEKLDHDPAKANALLDDAGYTKGDDGIRVDPKSERKLQFRLGIHADNDATAKLSTYLKGWFKEIGVGVDIQAMSSTKLNADLAKGDWDILTDSWSTGPDPTYLLGIQTCGALPDDNGEGGSTDSFFCDDEYDELYQDQQSTFDEEERADILRRMQAILYKANHNVIIYEPNVLGAHSDQVTGVVTGKPDADGTFPSPDAFTTYLSAAPVEETAAEKAAADGNGVLIASGVGAAVVLIAGGVVVARRRSAGDRE